MSAAAARRSTLVLGSAYLLVGVLGFVPGVTRPAEHPDHGLLFGVFAVSGPHKAVHLIAGVTLIAAAAIRAVLDAPSTSSMLLWMVAAAFALLVPAGFVASVAEAVPLNAPDTLFHALTALFAAFLARSVGRRGPGP